MLPFVLERDHFHVSFLSDDCEPHLSGPHSPDSEEEDENTVTQAASEGMDVDVAEEGVFNEEEYTIEEYVGGFLGGIDDLNNVASVRNSMERELEVEAPIIRDSELSIIDSVSPQTIFCSEVVLTMFDRTIKRFKAVMEMKKWVRKITYDSDLKRQRQWTSKFQRNRDDRSAKEFHEDSQMH